ncbi:MAG TPA: O-antigen ligase family protein [Pyrinomonadaceae bacterium]|nr:O-antigen ligase family protein [Pyrinomonadaceae bacterium]
MDSDGAQGDQKEGTQGAQAARLAQRTRAAERLALAGFLLFAVFAPHSIAGAEIGLALVGLGWLWRAVVSRSTGLKGRAPQDLPICLFLGWTVLSALLSEEPRISLPKLQSVCVVLLFYLTRAVLVRRTALLVAALMIASGVAGVCWSVIDIARGRGVRIEEMAAESPFRQVPVAPGDAVWRIGGRRVSSIEEIDDAIRTAPLNKPLSVSFIRQGEHGEWPALPLTDEARARPSPSGLKGSGPTHRFRASGWTRHYETFSETLQILAQLALGLALANMRKQFTRRRTALLLLLASGTLALGIVLTAMRTVLVALAIGACVIAWRAARKDLRLIIYAVIVLLLIVGSLAVWRTRSTGALSFNDDSTRLRVEVARVGLKRLMIHPFFGHGMDAVKKHWTEWGLPGTNMIHMHSTPLQLAFDRGLPALFLWLWIMASFWLTAVRGERSARDDEDTNCHGLLLGATGAIAGIFASSLVNYNFGDGEVALVFWWLMGVVVLAVDSGSLNVKEDNDALPPG